MSFWFLAVLIAGLVTGLIALAMSRGRDSVARPQDLQIYRDQLKEVDRDLERGVIAAEDADRVRIEVSRRLLDADRAALAVSQGTKPPRKTGMIFIVTVAVFGGTFALYEQLGAPNYRDLPLQVRIADTTRARANRPSQADAEATLPNLPPDPTIDPRMVELMEKLREALQTRPDDLQGHELLARNEAAMGNLKAASRALERVVRIKGDDVTSADYANLADMLVLAAGGYVSPEAEIALTRSLQRDPKNGTARYYSGLMFAQGQRPDLAFRLWRGLLNDSAPDDPWVEPVRSQIMTVAADAGVRYSLPDISGTGPSRADIAAAQDMSSDTRAEMIVGMVDQLSSRLAEQGGPPNEWAKLIVALGVLEDLERATLIWTEAKDVFATDTEALNILQAAATRAGLSQ